MDNSAKEKEALALISEADKRMKRSVSLFGKYFGSFSKAEEAWDMYTKAANIYKMLKNWRAAGDMFLKAARVQVKLDSMHNAAVSFISAGNAYRKVNAQEAIKCLKRAMDIYTDMGRFTIAAKHHVTVAEIYESDLKDFGKAVMHYEKAGDYYKGEESASSANKCFLKVAMYAAQQEQYKKAIQLYEKIGTYCMDHTLLKYSATDHFFKAALCHFCINILNTKLAVQRYEEMFPAFSDSRECKLVKKLLAAHEEQDVVAYAEAVKEFDSIARLDQWHTTMLHRIKEGIQMDETNLR